MGKRITYGQIDSQGYRQVQPKLDESEWESRRAARIQQIFQGQEVPHVKGGQYAKFDCGDKSYALIFVREIRYDVGETRIDQDGIPSTDVTVTIKSGGDSYAYSDTKYERSPTTEIEEALDKLEEQSDLITCDRQNQRTYVVKDANEIVLGKICVDNIRADRTKPLRHHWQQAQGVQLDAEFMDAVMGKMDELDAELQSKEESDGT